MLVLFVAPRARAQGTQLSNPEAIQLALEAVAAGKENKLEDCIAKDRASLEAMRSMMSRAASQ